MNEYLNLDEKINLLFDYVYNENSKKNIYNCNINIKNIKLDDIKFQIKNEDYYEEIKNEILDAKFKFINYSLNEDEYILLKRYSNNLSLAVKISFYKDNEIDNITSPINNENLFSYLLSILVLNNKIKHILLPIINFDINFTEIKNILSDDIINLIKNKYVKIDNLICCIQLREYFFKTYNLKEYLESNTTNLNIKPILFQLIYTLAIINQEYPGFKHNNITLKSIFLYLRKENNDIIYNGFKNDKFILNNSFNKFDIKLTNFDKANINNTKANTSNNDFKILFNEISKYKFCDNELLTFIKKNNNTYIDFLYDSYFKEYHKINDLKEKQLNKIKNYNSKFDLYMESDNYLNLGNQKKIYIGKKIRIIKSDIILSKIQRNNIRYPNNILIQKGGGNDGIIIKPMIKNNPFNSILEKEIMTEKYSEANKQSTNRKIEEIDEIDDDLKELSNKEPRQSKDLDKTITQYDSMNQPRDSYNQPRDSYNQPRDSYNQPRQNIDYNPNPFTTNQSYEKSKSYNKSNILTTKSEPTLLMEQRVYNTNNVIEKDKRPQPPMFIPIYGNQPTETILPYPFLPEMHQQKIVNINFGDRFSNFGALDRLYEDYLPGGIKRFTATTIYERNNLIQFVRNSIIKQTDGEKMSLTGKQDVLLSYIKIVNINPYNKNVNPFSNLAMNFLLYTAAYPIKYNETNSKIEIGNPAMGINVRIYGLSELDIKSEIFDNVHRNVWRELKYYIFVKDNIINKKISPNFISPILHKIDPDCKINWKELESVKYQNLPNAVLEIIRNNSYKIDMEKDTSVFNILKKYYRDTQQYELLEYIENVIEDKAKLQSDLRGNKYYIKNGRKVFISDDAINQIPVNINFDDKLTKDALILLTEAPTTNFKQWCSITREPFGAAYRMTSSGFHTSKIWKCIIFQLVYIFAVLEENLIYMEEISLDDNFYIKDIVINPSIIGSWIYKIDDLEFYLPNYGYILMFDSKFSDPRSKDKKYKILSTIFNKNITTDDTQIYNNNLDRDKIKIKIQNKFRQIIDPNNFCRYAKISGMNFIDNEIIELLNELNTNFIKHENIIELFTKTTIFHFYLHNRIGSYLTKIEKDNINQFLNNNIIKKGDICIHKVENYYKWALCMNKSEDYGRIDFEIMTMENQKIIIKREVGGKVIPFQDKLLPENTDEMRFDGSNIYETYIWKSQIKYF